jgi:hypothetical protein
VTPPSGKIKFQLTVMPLNLNTEALRIDILSYLYSQIVVLHCACFLFKKEAMQLEELCVVDHFIKYSYLHENEVTFPLCRVWKTRLIIFSACHKYVDLIPNLIIKWTLKLVFSLFFCALAILCVR